MKPFIVTVKHDNGKAKLRVNAMNEDSAKHLVCMAEGCPEVAVLEVKPAAYIKTIDKIIAPVSGKYGAPMGRSNVGTRPENQKIFDCAVPLSGDGSYDKGGAYWGIGSQLRVSYTKDLSYVEFYRKGENN